MALDGNPAERKGRNLRDLLLAGMKEQNLVNLVRPITLLLNLVLLEVILLNYGLKCSPITPP